MGRHHSFSSSVSASDLVDMNSLSEFVDQLECPFGHLENLTRSDLRLTAYEIFFMCCRSSPGFGGRGPSNLGPHPSAAIGEEAWEANGEGGTTSSGALSATFPGAMKGGAGLMVVNSKLKKVLGLKARRSAPMRTVSQATTGPNSPGKVRRPLTSAEIMRLQMKVTDHSDQRLRKTLMRTLVGQVGRRAETIILPLELLRQLKPSEFNDSQDYHQWQRRQLKILETGLLIHPTLSTERQSAAVNRFQEVLRASEIKPIDTSRNSEAMRILCESVVALAYRSNSGVSPDVCHWADGYPVGALLYISLLQSIFDLKEETVVLDEVDELLELMKKTWSSLGINKRMHNLCLTWLFFHQYVQTGQTEMELFSATIAMLAEVANDAKKPDSEAYYSQSLLSLMNCLQGWAEQRLLDYHHSFENVAVAKLEHVVSMAIATKKILSESFSSNGTAVSGKLESGSNSTDSTSQIDYYIKTSVRNAFTKILESRAANREDSIIVDANEDPSEIVVQLAKATEGLAVLEKEKFSPVMKKWHPAPTAAAVVTIHNCFHLVLRQYLSKVSNLTTDLVRVLQSAGKLEKVLIQMVADDSDENLESGKGIEKEMVSYEVEELVVSLLKTWIAERLNIAKECLLRAKETENWMPMSKTEPFAQSAVDLMRLSKLTIDEFFEIPVSSRDEMVQELATGFSSIFQDYTAFVASCGSKQSYIPILAPLTRCNQRSALFKLFKLTMVPCKCGATKSTTKSSSHDNPKPSTSRGTQRLYIRLNTLHYILTHLHALDKSLSFFPNSCPSPNTRSFISSIHFDLARASVEAAIHSVAEVVAYRLIFLDSQQSFVEGLYIGDVSNSRILPVLRTLKQNSTLLLSILVERAQALAVKEVMRAAFEAFLLVLLAGGRERIFSRTDYKIVKEDFESLKRAFCNNGEGLVMEEVVNREAEVVEGVLELMEMETERLIEEFSIAACEASGLGKTGQKVPMPPTTGRWNRTDPNTVLRVICYRNDDHANVFLKNNFQLARRQ